MNLQFRLDGTKQTWFELAKDHRYFDPWEAAPRSERERVVRSRLEEYVKIARELPFYQERLQSFDPKADFPLSKVPVLRPEELKAALPPFGHELVRGDGNAYNVFQSGGTTGFPKTALFSALEMEWLDFANARGYYAAGLLPSDRVGNLFAAGSLYMTFIHINTLLQNFGCASFAFSHMSDPAFFHLVASKFRINVLAGVSSVILNMLRSAETIGEVPLKIDRIYYGGEHMYEADKALLAEKFGTIQVLSPGYGTVDTWYIGYQCQQAPTGVFHAFDDQCYIEIVDEETDEACEAGRVGMIYATAFPRRLTPIVRYRVGDLARWLANPCPCGRETPLFELLGRGDDKFRIGYDTIEYDQLVGVLSHFGTQLGPFQMERVRKDARDQLILRIECDAPDEERARLTRDIESAVLRSRPVMAKNIQEGTVLPMSVELVASRSLPLNPRTGKLRRVIDIKG